MLGVGVREQGSVPLSPGEAQAARAILRQRRRNSFPYYSTVKFNAVRAGAGPYTYTIAAGTVARAFSYAVGEPMVPAGFLAGDGNASMAETNLQQRNQTISGQNVLIYGIAAKVEPGGVPTTHWSDARFAAQIFTNTSIELSLNGDENRFKLGVLGMLPGAGGLMGPGWDSVNQQSLDGVRMPFDLAHNGWPVASNYFKLPEGLVWRTQSRADSMLNLICTVQREIVISSGGTVENAAADEVAAAGVRGFAFPTVLFCLIKFHLKGWIVGPRTSSA